MKNKIESERIRIGKITYFDVEHNGSLVPPVSAYVFMVNVNGTYINPFDLNMELPIYDRVPYSNTTRDGESYGTKIKHIQGEIENGPCVVLETTDVGRLYKEDEISTDMMEEYMLESDKFFVDRIDLYEKIKTKKNLFWALDNRLATIRQRDISEKFFDDLEKLEKFNDFIKNCEEEKQYTR